MFSIGDEENSIKLSGIRNKGVDRRRFGGYVWLHYRVPVTSEVLTRDNCSIVDFILLYRLQGFPVLSSISWSRNFAVTLAVPIATSALCWRLSLTVVMMVHLRLRVFDSLSVSMKCCQSQIHNGNNFIENEIDDRTQKINEASPLILKNREENESIKNNN